MNRTTVRWMPVVAIAALVPLLSLATAGCDTQAAQELHEETSTACSGHDCQHAGEGCGGHAAEGCGDHADGEEHEDASGACSGCSDGHEAEGDHEAHQADDHEASDECGGNDHGHEADNTEGHEGHEHSDHAGEAGLTLSERDRREAGIKLAAAGPGRLALSTRLLGEVRLNEEQLAHVVPPVPAVVREVKVRLGDEVRAGELLAVLASRELADARSQYLTARGRRELAEIAHQRDQELWERKLLAEQDRLDARQAMLEADVEFQAAEQTLRALGVSDEELKALKGSREDGALTRCEVRSPIDGAIVELHLALGEMVGEDSDVLTIADLSTVWVDLDVPQADLGSIREGLGVTISAAGVDLPDASGVIDFVSPVVDQETRAALARVEIPNSDGRWRPGLFVTAFVAAAELEVPVMIPKDAVQSLEGETVVFIPDGETFESVPVVLGRSNATHVEVESGLLRGEPYVSEGAFTLKAEVVTSGLDSHAGHGH